MTVRLGPPEAAARAAVDKGWFRKAADLRVMGYGKGMAGTYQATKDLTAALKAQSDTSRVIGVYQSGLPVGFYWLEYLGDRKRAVQIHAFIAPESRGKWAFHMASLQLLDKLFAEGVYRVEVEPLRINKRMIRLLRHYGFKQEGIKRSSYWMDGNDYDQVMMRLLKREWNKRKKEK